MYTLVSLAVEAAVATAEDYVKKKEMRKLGLLLPPRSYCYLPSPWPIVEDATQEARGRYALAPGEEETGVVIQGHRFALFAYTLKQP